jgi:DNA-binding response OmpR family regulator
VLFEKHKEKIALAVIDIVMPRKGGKNAFEEMCRSNPKLKVIFMSGYAANAIHDSFVLVLGTPFLPKPFGPRSLGKKVREVLDR